MKHGTHWKPEPPRKREERGAPVPPYAPQMKLMILREEQARLERELREQFAARRVDRLPAKREAINTGIANRTKLLRAIKRKIAKLSGLQ